MTIRFLRDYTVQDREGNQFAEGEVRDDLSPESEQHFINRGAAALVEKAEGQQDGAPQPSTDNQRKPKRGRRASR